MSAKSKSKKKILIVDGVPLFREGLSQLLNGQSDLLCCGEAVCLATLLQAVAAKTPDLVMLDLRLRHEDGFQIIKLLRARFPAVRILVISQSDEALYAERALRAGAEGYVMKDESPDEVLTAIRSVLANELFVSRKMAACVLKRFLSQKSAARTAHIESLSDRELQVFRLLGTGKDTRQIAALLKLSPKTVETYRENIKHKLALPRAAEVVRYATAWVEGRHTDSAPGEPEASRTASRAAAP